MSRRRSVTSSFSTNVKQTWRSVRSRRRLRVSWADLSIHLMHFSLESSCLRNLSRTSAGKEKSEKRYSTGSATILSPPVSLLVVRRDTCLSSRSRKIKATNYREHGKGLSMLDIVYASSSARRTEKTMTFSSAIVRRQNTNSSSPL